MKKQDIKKTQFPDAPGIYFFRGPRKKILYIGKATSLRERIKSYFTKDIVAARGPGIAKMIADARSVTFQKADSVLEALILEAALIKRHQPKYNAKEKSDKSFNYVIITKEAFPRVLLMRERELQATNHSLLTHFGPFPQGGVLRDALKIVRKIFPFRDRCLPCPAVDVGLAQKRGRKSHGKIHCRACFNRQIGLCPGVCTGEVTRKEYAATIRNLKLFFEGKKSALLRNLKREMQAHAKKHEFEKAQQVKKTLFALEHIQDIALLKSYPNKGLSFVGRIEGYDIAHISGTYLVGVMTVVSEGEPQKDKYRKFKIRTVAGADDTASLAEVLERRFAHPEWVYPRLIVIDGGKAQKNRAEKVLRDLGVAIPVVSVVKDERHKPREILGDKKYIRERERDILLANSEAHRFAVAYHRTLRGKIT